MSARPDREEDGQPARGTGRSGRRWWGVAAGACLGAAAVAGLVAYAVTPRPAAVVGAAPAAASASPTRRAGPGAGRAALPAGRPAPGFSLPRLGGGPSVSLAAEHGHPVVLSFFASWCPDCRKELAAFAAVSRDRGPVRFLAVDTADHQPGKARELLRRAGDRYPVGTDPQARVANGKYLVNALPATVFISARGRIAGEVFGAQTVKSLRPWIRTLIRSGR